MRSAKNMKKKLTQKQLCLAKLMITNDWVPVFEFMGEFKFCGKWEFLSYKGTARISSVYLELPNKIERKQIRGKSGKLYYVYKIKERNFAYMLDNAGDYTKVIIRYKNYINGKNQSR